MKTTVIDHLTEPIIATKMYVYSDAFTTIACGKSWVMKTVEKIKEKILELKKKRHELKGEQQILLNEEIHVLECVLRQFPKGEYAVEREARFHYEVSEKIFPKRGDKHFIGKVRKSTANWILNSLEKV